MSRGYLPRRTVSLDKTKTRSNREQTKFPLYLRWIREQHCIIPGCGMPAECAHLRMSSAEYGKVNFRDDKWCNPLCAGHHRLYPDAQHNGSEAEFWERHKINPMETAKRYWERFNDPDRKS